MPLIIDTYNVLHTGGILPPELAEYGDVEGLVRLLALSRYRNERIELVCDGSPQRPVAKGRRGSGVVSAGGSQETDEPQTQYPGAGAEADARRSNLNVRFSGPGREADEVIAMLVRHSTAPRNLTVVSSDGAVLRSARRRKCRTLTSQQFLERLAADFAAATTGSPPPASKPPGGLSDDQVEAWMAVFDVDEAEAERAAKRRPKKTHASDATAASDNEPIAPQRGPVLPQEIIEEAERLLRERRSE